MTRTCLLTLVVLMSACTKQPDPVVEAPAPTAADTRAADEASLLKVAREAGVSDQDALKAKAELDKVYDDTSAAMSEAEKKRNARDAAFKDEACIADCGH